MDKFTEIVMLNDLENAISVPCSSVDDYGRCPLPALVVFKYVHSGPCVFIPLCEEAASIHLANILALILDAQNEYAYGREPMRYHCPVCNADLARFEDVRDIKEVIMWEML